MSDHYTIEDAERDLRRQMGVETPEEKIGRLEAEVQRLKEKAQMCEVTA